MKPLSTVLSLIAFLTVFPCYAAFIENDSYETLCAEMDNVNIPIWSPGVTSLRILATNPRYYPTTINEWGADWEDCSFASDRNLWIIGYMDGQYSEFMQGYSFTNGDTYFAPDNPAAGIDEPFNLLPREINHDWMTDQYIRFTADEINDVNLEVRIGAVLTVAMAAINGQLDVEARALTTNGWISLGRQIFNTGNMIRTWNIPDHTWIEGTDSNAVHLHVVRESEGGQSTPGSWAYYDYLQLRRRDERGDNSGNPAVLYTDVNTRVEAVWIDFWWRNPREMRIEVLGGATINTSQYLRIKRRMPNSSDWNEIFVLYEDGNARIIPYPPEGLAAVPYGASIILGPTTNGPRPAIGIDEVIVDPTNLTLHITYENGGSADVALRAHRDGHYVDVYNIRYDTTNYAPARVRSMWVYDGKADIDHIACAQGLLPVLHHWTRLEGTWWAFTKETPSYHNTYCPEFLIELLDLDSSDFVRQAETYTSVSNAVIQSGRTNAFGNQTLKFDATGGSATYVFNLEKPYSNTFMRLRYSDPDAGNGIDSWGNRVRVIADNARTVDVYAVRTRDWDEYRWLPRIPLGDLAEGTHEILLQVESGTSGIELDVFTLDERQVSAWIPHSVLTQQAEDYTWQTNSTYAYRSGAVGGASMHLEHTGVPPSLGFAVNMATSVAHAYMRIRYADDVGPTAVRVAVDGQTRAKFPTQDTGWWNDFTNAAPLYLGAITAGVRQVVISSSLETWGVDIDEFEIFSYDNRPPSINIAGAFEVPVGMATNVTVMASDPDGDTVSLTAISKPEGAVFVNGLFVWTASVDRCGTTNLLVIRADDGRNITNSIVHQVAYLTVPTDWDGDGLWDGWEWQEFGSYAQTADDDDDGDGANNYHESIAGTSPHDPFSAFRTTLRETQPLSTARVIMVTTKPRRRYSIYYADALPTNSTQWTPFANPASGVWVETNQTSSTHLFVDDETADTTGGPPTTGRRYYRVKVETVGQP